MKPNKEQLRKKRHRKIRSRISGTAKHPRLVVFRSLTGIYAQLVDDSSGKIIAACSSLKLKEKGVKVARSVGMGLAKAAMEKKIESCVFDRGGYLYHGRVKALAEGAREGGLKF